MPNFKFESTFARYRTSWMLFSFHPMHLSKDSEFGTRNGLKNEIFIQSVARKIFALAFMPEHLVGGLFENYRSSSQVQQVRSTEPKLMDLFD